MLNGQYVGCTTGFSQSDKTDIFIPNQKVDATATPYLQRLVAVNLIKVEQTSEPVPVAPPVVIGEPVVDGVYPEPLICVPQSSEWSRPITWEMVNKPAQNGGVTVDLGYTNYLGDTNYWIDLRKIHTIDEFFADLVNQAKHFSYFNINTRKNSDGSISVQYAPRTSSVEGAIADHIRINQHGEFYVYDVSNIGNNAESVIYLADAFDEPPSFTACTLPIPGYLLPR